MVKASRIINEQIIAAFRPQQIKAATEEAARLGKTPVIVAKGVLVMNRRPVVQRRRMRCLAQAGGDADPQSARFLGLEDSQTAYGIFPTKTGTRRWASQRKRICWSFECRAAACSLTPIFRCLSDGLKAVHVCLCAGIRSTRCPWLPARYLQNLPRVTKRFVDHLSRCPHPVLRFKDVLPHHCKDYIEAVLGGASSHELQIRVSSRSCRSSFNTGASQGRRVGH